jgi:hypothetical protein
MKREPDDEAQRGREARGFRIDLAIAICALFVSTLATGASWWQSRVVQQQLSAQVWPYVAISTTTGADSVRVALVNYGLGPAIVRDEVLTVDGRPQRDIPSGIVRMLGDLRSLRGQNPPNATATFRLSSIGPGSVIRPGEDRALLDISGNAAVAQRLIAGVTRFDLHVCYCSILDQCWRTDFSDSNGAPQPAVCNTHDPDAVQTFDARKIQSYFKPKPASS